MSKRNLTTHIFANLRVACGVAVTAGVLCLAPLAKAAPFSGPHYSVANWQGSIYKFERTGDAHLLASLVDSPTTPSGGNTASVDWRLPGSTFWDSGGRIFSNGQLTPSTVDAGYFSGDFPMAQVSPIAVNTGAFAKSNASLSVFWVRWIDGWKGANNKAAWTVVTLNRSSGGDWLADSTWGAGTADSAGDIAATNPAYKMYESVPQVGAVALPDTGGAITAHPAYDRSKITIAWWNFGAPDRHGVNSEYYGLTPEQSPLSYALPSGVSAANWDGNIDLCIGHNLADPTLNTSTPVNLWLALRNTAGEVYIGSSRVGNTRSQLAITWQKVSGLTGVVHSLLRLDATGKPSLNFTQKVAGDNTAMRRLALSGSASSGIKIGSVVKRDDIWVGPSGRTPEWAISFGSPPSPTNSEVLVPAYDNWIGYNTGHSKWERYTEQFGNARRSALLSIPRSPADPQYNPSGQKYALIGIIEGPPPIPNENIIHPSEPLKDRTVGKTTYGVKVGQESETSIKGAAGPIVKVEGAVGTPLGKAEYEGQVSVLIGGGTATQKTTTMMTSEDVEGSIVDDFPGKTEAMIRPEGVAFLYQSGFAGFNYQIVDKNRVPYPGSTTFLQLWPSDPRIVAYPYTINPDGSAGIIPGQLPSYVVSPDVAQQLMISSSFPLNQKDSSGSTQKTTGIEVSWTSAGGVQQELATISKTTKSFTVDVDFEAMVGGEAGNKELGDYADIKAGVKGNLSYESNIGNETEETLSSEVSTPPPSYTDGGYTRYTYTTVMLQPNSYYTRQLLESLKYKDPQGNNAQLASLIFPNSQPWKITYFIQMSDTGIPDYYKAPPVAGGLQAATPNPAMNNPRMAVPASIKALGVDNPDKMGQLLTAVRANDKNRTRGGLMSLKPPKGVTPEIATLARSLTPQQRMELDAHVKATQAQAFQSFTQKFPRWQPRAFPITANSFALPGRPPLPAATAPTADTPPTRPFDLRVQARRTPHVMASIAVPTATVQKTPAPVPALSPQALQQLHQPQ